MGLVVRASGRTDRGKVRPNNEDYFLLFDEYKEQKQMDWDRLVSERGRLYIVADGLGGHRAGEVASREATLAFVEKYYADDPERFRSRLDEYMDHPLKWLLLASMASAHLAITDKVEEEPGKYRGMGTTLTAATLLDDRRMFVIHMGDTRLYILRGDELKQITKDHTYIQQFIDRGEITKEQARHAPGKHMLTRAVGIEHSDGSPSEPDVYEHDLKAGDRLLLCSDGLTDMLSDEEIKEVLKTARSVSDCTETLVNRALDAGGKDNVTVVAIDVVEV